ETAISTSRRGCGGEGGGGGRSDDSDEETGLTGTNDYTWSIREGRRSAPVAWAGELWKQKTKWTRISQYWKSHVGATEGELDFEHPLNSRLPGGVARQPPLVPARDLAQGRGRADRDGPTSVVRQDGARPFGGAGASGAVGPSSGGGEGAGEGPSGVEGAGEGSRGGGDEWDEIERAEHARARRFDPVGKRAHGVSHLQPGRRRCVPEGAVGGPRDEQQWWRERMLQRARDEGIPVPADLEEGLAADPVERRQDRHRVPRVTQTRQSVSMDFMDTLVTSKSGKRHIFVIIDRFTKYARLVAMPETARTDHVIKLWVRDFGLPKTIVSDRDVRFTSELWKKTAEQMGSQLQMTSGNHPEANGQAEQMNKVVQHLLRHYIKPNQDDWDEKLPLIASLSNNAVHSSTGVSPNQLHLGWKPRSALDFLLPENRPAATPGTLEYGVQYEKLLQQVVEHIKKAQQAMIASKNQHRRQSSFQVGECVWVKASEPGQEFGISRKLMPRYFGPWEVLDIVGDEMDGPTYVIRIPGHLRTHPVFHASKLAPFAETDQFPSRRSMLPPTMDGQVDIDYIVDHKDLPVQKPLGRGRPPKPKREYRVRFRHHTDPKEDRWFAREELIDTAPQVVAEYEKKLKGKAPAKLASQRTFEAKGDGM
ncbi:hypothetical protein CBR_g45834, partial [Chara braunii]